MRWFYVTFFLATWLGAQENVTLNQALDKVRHNNVEVLIATFDEEIARLEHEIAQGASWGSLDVTQSALRSNDALSVFGFKLQSREATFGDFGFAQFDQTNPNVLHVKPDDLNYPKVRNHFQTALEYTLPLYTGGKIEAYQKITQSLKTLKALSKEQLLAQKLLETRKTFYTLSLLQHHLSQLRVIASNVEKIEATTIAMAEEGYAKKVDLLEVQARKSDVERLIHQTESNHALLLQFLSFLVNEKVESIALVEEDVALTYGDEGVVLERNFEIQKALKGVDISQMNIELSQSAFLPILGAFASYGSSDNQFLNDFSDHESYTIGLQMRWNLFHGGSDSSALEKARVEHLKAKQQLFLAQKATHLQWQKLRTQVKNDTFEIESLKKEVTLARTIYENYEGRYREKLVSMNDVLMKQSDEISKTLKLRELQNRRNETLFELETLINKEVP